MYFIALSSVMSMEERQFDALVAMGLYGFEKPAILIGGFSRSHQRILLIAAAIDEVLATCSPILGCF
jgi:hypothetical protein